MRPVIILSSASPRRKELLDSAGLRFDVRVFPSDGPETGLSPVGTHPAVFALDAARGKAEIAKYHLATTASIVICADTIVSLDDTIFGKPADIADAVSMLSSLSGRHHSVITACTITSYPENRHVEFTEKTLVYFRPLTTAQIDAYVATGEPMDKAGAYGIQGKASAYIEKIEGCYANVVGLPVSRLLAELRDNFGVSIEDWWQ